MMKWFAKYIHFKLPIIIQKELRNFFNTLLKIAGKLPFSWISCWKIVRRLYSVSRNRNRSRKVDIYFNFIFFIITTTKLCFSTFIKNLIDCLVWKWKLSCWFNLNLTILQSIIKIKINVWLILYFSRRQNRFNCFFNSFIFVFNIFIMLNVLFSLLINELRN